MKWKGKLIKYLIDELKNDEQWENTIKKLLVDDTIGIHLAIFNEPYLSLIYQREKKVESRFSINKISPYERVKKGDVVILKESGGLVTGVFIAGYVKFYQGLNREKLKEIEHNYGKEICSRFASDFWSSRVKANYASLIEVKKVRKLTPFKSEKKDRTGWSILKVGISHNLFTSKK